MKQIEIIPKIKQLCIEGKYDEAIQLTGGIENMTIATKAHLLCIEHAQSKLEKNIKRGKPTGNAIINGTQMTFKTKELVVFMSGSRVGKTRYPLEFKE